MKLEMNRRTVIKALPIAGVLLVLVCWLGFTLAVNAGAIQVGHQADSKPVWEKPSAEAYKQADQLRIGSMKGPTSVGLASMMANKEGQFTVVASADELAPKLLQGQLDIALLPANVAATLYNKTNGAIRVIDVNTLGVLYGVSQATSATSVADIAKRPVYMTGKGAVPEYTFNALLQAAGIAPQNVNIQFCSEPAEVVAQISANAEAVGILPQPYATAATMKNPALNTVLDLTTAWQEVTEGARGSFITGVTVTTDAVLAEKGQAIDAFLARHKESVKVANEDTASVAQTVVDLGIIDNAKLAESAIPFCNVVCWTGTDMKNALSAFLNVLFAQNAASIGGAVPADNFYYLP